VPKHLRRGDANASNSHRDKVKLLAFT